MKWSHPKPRVPPKWVSVVLVPLSLLFYFIYTSLTGYRHRAENVEPVPWEENDWSEFPFYFTASVVVYYFIYLPIQIWRLRRWQRKHGD